MFISANIGGCRLDIKTRDAPTVSSINSLLSQYCKASNIFCKFLCAGGGGGAPNFRFALVVSLAKTGPGWVTHALYPRERPGTQWIRGCVGPRAGLDGCGISCPSKIRSPDRPALSESLYRLNCPSPLVKTQLSYYHGSGKAMAYRRAEASFKKSAAPSRRKCGELWSL
jgi:hypothetical protein